jgi:hypothetical protein
MAANLGVAIPAQFALPGSSRVASVQTSACDARHRQLQYTLIASSAGFQKPRQLIPRPPQRPNPRSLTRVRDLSH